MTTNLKQFSSGTSGYLGLLSGLPCAGRATRGSRDA